MHSGHWMTLIHLLCRRGAWLRCESYTELRDNAEWKTPVWFAYTDHKRLSRHWEALRSVLSSWKYCRHACVPSISWIILLVKVLTSNFRVGWRLITFRLITFLPDFFLLALSFYFAVSISLRASSYVLFYLCLSVPMPRQEVRVFLFPMSLRICWPGGRPASSAQLARSNPDRESTGAL